jgi:hypothetical protein
MVLKSSARRGFMVLGSNGKAIFVPGEERCWPTLSCTHLFMLGTLKDESMPPTRNSKTTNVFFHLPVLTVSRESIMRVTNYWTIKKFNISNFYEYSEIVADTPKPFRGHVVGDSFADYL